MTGFSLHTGLKSLQMGYTFAQKAGDKAIKNWYVGNVLRSGVENLVHTAAPGMPLLQEAARLSNEARVLEKRAAIFALRAALLEERFQKTVSSSHHDDKASDSVHDVYRRVSATRRAERGLPVSACRSSWEVVSAARATRDQAAQIKAESRRTREYCAQQRQAIQAAVQSSRIALEIARSQMNVERVLGMFDPIGP